MVEPRTIDDLGVETSVRWATDQEYLDKTITKESPFVSRQTTVDVSSPFFKSEFDLLFEVKQRYQHWANFFAPKEYMEQKMRLFTFQVIPSLGSEELQLAQMQKIKDKLASSIKERKEKGKVGEFAWQDQKGEEDEMRESKTLLDLLEYINEIDKLIVAINSRRSQYAKG